MEKKLIDFSRRDYRTYWDVSLDLEDYFDSYGYTVIPILPELTGKLWDKKALAFVLAMNPREIRVTTGGRSMDGVTDRITVVVNEDGIIRKIEKEITIALVDEWRYGHDADVYFMENKENT
jgi:hypothetical protein